MAVGRKFKLKKGADVLAGIRTKTLTYSGESIDLTSDDDLGKRLLDPDAAQEQIDISFDGIMKGDTLRALVLGSTSKLLTDITLEWPIMLATNTVPAKLVCNFRLTGYEEGGAYNDAVTFSGTLESSGAWTYTPEAAA